MEKRKKIKKGEYGYISSQKKRRTFYTILAFIGPLIIFFTGLFIYDSRKTIFTVIAAVASLPACKLAVGAIMMYLQKPMDENIYLQIEKHKRDLVCGYELVITAYEKQTFLESAAVCGNTVAAYSSREKTDVPFAEKHIQSILRQNGFYVNVKICKRLPEYLSRLDSMWEHREALEKDIKFTPNENYPDLSRNELILHTIYAISL